MRFIDKRILLSYVRAFVVFTSFLTLSSSAFATEKSPFSREPILWGASIYKPWLMSDGDRHHGILYEIVKSLVGKLDLELQIKVKPARRLLLDAIDGESDFVIAPSNLLDSYGNDRIKQELNCRRILFQTDLVGFGLKEKFNERIERSDFHRYTFLLRPAQKKYVVATVGQGEFKTSVRPSEHLVKALLAHRADIIVGASVSIYMAAVELDVAELITKVHSYGTTDFAVCFSRKFIDSQPLTWLSQLDRALHELAKDQKLISRLNEQIGAPGLLSIAPYAASSTPPSLGNK